MDRMTDDKLKALIDNEIRQAIGGMSGSRLSEQRRKAEYYYLGLAKGDLSPPEIDGRSNFVDTTVRNQIEWMIPSLMKTFCSSDRVVEFEATKPGDEDKASNATEYINYLFFKKNEGYKVLQTAIRDALLQKAGIIKVWWDDRVEESREEYRALSEMDLAILLQDEEIEPIEQKSYPDEEDAKQRQQAIEQLTPQLNQAMQAAQGGDQNAMQSMQMIQQQIQSIQSAPPKMVYDVSFKRSKKSGKVCIENVPPEEFIISRKSKRMDDQYMKGHRVLRTISDLKAMGYENVDDVHSDTEQTSFQGERVERQTWDDDAPILSQDDYNLDPSMRQVWINELYMKIDYDGDGIAEWRKIVKAGNAILENVECDGVPFAEPLVPVILPHRFFGLSIADLGMEQQKLQTQLVRATLDNQFLQVNGRYWAVEGQVNLDDLLTSRPGGVVRTKTSQSVGRLDQAHGDTAGAMQMLEWAQDYTENATGWTRRSQGTGPTGLQSQTATGMNIITNRDDMRLDLIARNFAEGGVSDLFKKMLKLVCQYQNKKDTISVTGEMLDIDPREWKNQFTLNISVGLGTNNKEQQAQHLMGLLSIQEKALQIGVATPENVYNAAKLYAEALGQKSSDKFFTDPAKQPPQPPKPDPEMLKLQASQQQSQAQMQLEAQKHQLEMQQRDRELQQEAAIREHEIQLEAQKQQLQAQADMEERQHKAELDAQLKAQELDFKRWEVEFMANKDVLVAQINAAKGAEDNSNGEKQALAMAMQGFTAALSNMNAPRSIVRDENGRAQGIV